MSSSHSGGTSQSLQEDHPIVAHHAGASSVDVNGHQHTEILSDPPHGIPSRRSDSAGATVMMIPPASERTPLLKSSPPTPRLHELEDDVHDVASAEQIPTSKMFHEELRTLTLYSLPVFGTQLFEFSFVLATVISIGHISTVALAAATLASMTASVTGYSIVQGFASALDTLLPPAWTSDRPHMVGLWTQRMVLMTGMVLIPIIAIWFNAESILLALNQEPEVARLAAIYLRWASLGLPACTFNCISRRYFQSQGLFDIPTKITLVVAPINAFLNWLFVYPLGLSFRGAPFATALSFNLVSVASIFCGYYYASPTAWSPITRESFNPVTGELWKGWGLLARLGIAGVGQTASEWWSWELIGLAASRLGPVALASQFVLLISQATTYQAPFALGIATSVRIGNLLGEGRARRARIAAATSVVMAFGLACLISIFFIAFRNKLGYLFNSDPEVVSLVASIFPLVALFQVFDGTAGIVSGIFRARGKQSVGALLNLSAYYVLGIPLGLYLTFVHGRGLAGLWEGLTAALVYCSVVGLWVGVYRVDWEAEVASAQARVGGKDVGDATDE
ncbi:mate-domain-containing protein [Boletus edulis BED1]|uniref:Mate-domain-containing protein n=1 Tax=Boletus edulis BED1 TaxID=1328754 RepID=A0AAD4BXC6_BOLED|nr:mate-domain-containing protein [Boletus edulis BED1]